MSGGIVVAAAKHDNVLLLEWAAAQGLTCILSPNAIDMAAYHGNLVVMQWLFDHGCPIGPKATIKAAGNAQQSALLFLIDIGALFDNQTKVKALKAVAAALTRSTSKDTRNDVLFQRADALVQNGVRKGWWNEIQTRDIIEQRILQQ